MNRLQKRIVEYFALTYFNWLVVVPLLAIWVIFMLKFTEEQFWLWFSQSFLISLFMGWWTVKCDARFEPWLRRRLGITKSKCKCCGK